MYGYQDDQQEVASQGSGSIPYHFGGNFGVARLKKMEWIPNGGKGGAAQEVMDIVFEVDGKDVSYRQFPITRAFDSNGNEVRDPNSEPMKKAFSSFNANICSIIACFVPREVIKAALSRPFSQFQEYCQTVQNLLPPDFASRPLDVFMQYQNKIRGNAKQTYLEFPKDLSNGYWVVAAIAPQAEEGQVAEWKEVRKTSYDNNTKDALVYVDGKGNFHTFVRSGWFMDSNYAKVQKEDSSNTDTSAVSTPATGGVGEARW